MKKWAILILIVFLLGWTMNSVYSSYVEEPKPFTIYTEAVCEEQDNYIFCHDEFFIEYDGFKYQVPRSENLGSATHSLGWEDPRK